MKREWQSKDGPVVLMMCKCSVWPIYIRSPLRRCSECGVKPQPIPPWQERT